MKRILSCCPVPLDPRLGMAKHALESAEALRAVGWSVEVVGPDEIAGGPIAATPEHFPAILRHHLRQVGGRYDLIEYDYAYLPFPRADFAPGPLFVARSMLLHHHFLTTPIPPVPRLRSRVKHLLTRRQRRSQLAWLISQADATVRQADLTIVSNDRDATALIRHGHDAARIAVLPLGLTDERLQALGSVPTARPSDPVVGFVGMFDPRKGMSEFPELVARVVQRVPRARFRLLGSAGLVPDADGVRRYFPRRWWPRLEIHPRFDPAELPGLLAGVSVGVFPSRVEGFGYGVLEMLAAGIPVVAYDAPGPHGLLPPELRVPVGAVAALASAVADLLDDPDQLVQARREARARASHFRWSEIAGRTSALYLSRIAQPIRSN